MEREELLQKLQQCELKKNFLAYGIQSHEDFLEYSKYVKQANAYRKALKELDKEKTK